MAPRTQLEITTASVIRLVKEEASYHRELEQQAERIKKSESGHGGDDENKEFLMKQEVCISYPIWFLNALPFIWAVSICTCKPVWFIC